MTLLRSSTEATERFERLFRRWARNGESGREEAVREAFSLAQELYGDRMHWTGEPLIEHTMGVCEEILRYTPDADSVIACFLHHVLDTKLWTLDDLESRFGSVVRSLVSGAHLLAHVSMNNRRISLENMRLMFVRVSDDARVVLLILCDHNHVLQRLHAMRPDHRKHMSRDILHLFAPVAARLGIYSLKHQLESRAFPVAYPTDAARLAEQMHQMHVRFGAFLEPAAERLRSFLHSEGVEAKVEGREKQPYSAFQKMRLKSLTHVQDLYDLFALRVIVGDEGACYQTLGLLHRVGHPVAHRFKDYIAFPKPNGYQSLHTTLARLPGVPDGVFIEVQIRTKDMHRDADLGVAAHWNYKEGGTAEQAARRAHMQRALAFQQPVEERQHSTLSDHIFVLTPKGEVLELPEGATPLDFAFHVHTALGLSYRAARVNGSIVPLTYQLENGDIIEILRTREPHPSHAWLTILKTASARSRLKRYLATNDRPLFVQLGRDALNRELQRHHFPPLDPDLTLMRLLDGKRIPVGDREDILMKIGQGSQNAASILSHLTLLKAPRIFEETARTKKHLPGAGAPETGVVLAVEGNIPMPVRAARCCKVDETKERDIVGVIGRDGVVRAHRARCKMLKNGNPERRIGVVWRKAEKKKTLRVAS